MGGRLSYARYWPGGRDLSGHISVRLPTRLLTGRKYKVLCGVHNWVAFAANFHAGGQVVSFWFVLALAVAGAIAVYIIANPPERKP